MGAMRAKVLGRLILPTLLLVGLPQAWAGPIYVFKEADGAIRFTDKPPAGGVKAQVFTGKGARYFTYRGKGWGWSYTSRLSSKLFENRFHDDIAAAADRHGVDIYLLKAVIHAESGFDPHAVSPKGARGLMQLMPSRARLLGVANSFMPQDNIDGGARHLAFLIKRYNGNLKLALAAYNAGEGAVDQYGGIPPYSETRQYVDRVLSLREKYRASAANKSKRRQ
ncbi:MAG: lytic transglycosylase domain-containing protein [Oligoflexia bacterium]|nr:lytic transglycosylase domain-containing protein [Oligoflexia bacterium]